MAHAGPFAPDPAIAVAAATWSPADRLRTVTVRPIRPDDAERLGRLLRRLSRETVHKRFFTAVVDPPASALRHLAEVDHVHREAFVAVVRDEVVGVARFEGRVDDDPVAEAAVVVEDAWQRRGIGRRLLRHLGRAAAAQGITRFTASALATNVAPVHLARSLAPLVEVRLDGGEVALVIPLPDDRRDRPAATAGAGADPATSVAGVPSDGPSDRSSDVGGPPAVVLPVGRAVAG